MSPMYFYNAFSLIQLHVVNVILGEGVLDVLIVFCIKLQTMLALMRHKFGYEN